VVVHVCGDGCDDDYENGSRNLAESQADGDVALTARWKHQREKVASEGSILEFSRGYSFPTGYVPGTDEVLPMVDRTVKCLLSVISSAR